MSETKSAGKTAGAGIPGAGPFPGTDGGVLRQRDKIGKADI